MRLQLRAKRTVVALLIFVVSVVLQYTKVGNTADGDGAAATKNVSASSSDGVDADKLFEGYVDRFNNSEGFDTKPTPIVNASDVPGNGGVEKILIIATAPFDYAHTLALWTHLECVTGHIDRVVVAAPDAYWSRGIVELVVDQFRLAMEDGNATNAFVIETAFYVNNRYDVGLWCDGITYHLGYDGVGYNSNNNTNSSGTASGGKDAPKAIFLINDSAMSLRRYDDLTKKIARFALSEAAGATASPGGVGVKLAGLNGLLYQSHRGARCHNRPGGCGFYWVESVYRGLTPAGAAQFYKHSCRLMYEKGRYPCRVAGNRKRCIVDTYEKGLADWFDHGEIDAMYPSYRPNGWDVNVSDYERDHGDVPGYPYDQWLKGRQWHRYLVNQHGFPFRKVSKSRGMRTDECTRLAGDKRWMEILPYPDTGIMQSYQEEMAKSLQEI